MVDDRFYSMRGAYKKASPIIIPPDAGVLQSISFSRTPASNSFTEGDSFPISEFAVSATYSIGGTYDVTSACTFTVNDPIRYGDTTLLVTYETLSITWSYVVVGRPVPAPSNTLALFHLDDNASNATGRGGGFNWFSNTSAASITYRSNGKFEKCAQLKWGYLACSAVPTIYEIWHGNVQNSITYSAYARITEIGSQRFSFTVCGDQYRGSSSNEYAGIEIGTSYTNNKLYITGLIFHGTSGITGNTLATPYELDTSWHRYALYVTRGSVSFYIDGSLACTADMTNASFSNYYYQTRGVGAAFSDQTATYIDEVLICEGLGGVNPENGPYYIS